MPRNSKVAAPADNPKNTSSLLFREYSIVLLVKILAQNTMVKGLEYVRINVLIKLLKRVASFILRPLLLLKKIPFLISKYQI